MEVSLPVFTVILSISLNQFLQAGLAVGKEELNTEWSNWQTYHTEEQHKLTILPHAHVAHGPRF